MSNIGTTQQSRPVSGHQQPSVDDAAEPGGYSIGWVGSADHAANMGQFWPNPVHVDFRAPEDRLNPKIGKQLAIWAKCLDTNNAGLSKFLICCLAQSH